MIYINNKPIQIINWDYTILQVSEQVGISIPRFCYHEQLTIAGNCRMCMVEVKNVLKPVIACATSLTKEMHIFTNSELVKIARENVLELLLINHPLDCPICDQGGERDLQDLDMVFGTDRGRFIESKRSVEDKEFGPIVKTIMTRCIHRTRCVRYAEELAGLPIIGTMGRGKETEISTYIGSKLDSEIIGNIVDICPVGALTSKPYAFKARSWELQNMDSYDIFDSLGSFIRIDVKGNEVMRILPRKNDVLNEEWITDKVRFFYEGTCVNRLLFPVVKTKENNINYLVYCSMEFALNLFVNLYNKSKLALDKSMISISQDNMDLMDLLFYRILMDRLNINVYHNSNISKCVSSDIRKDWLLNSSIIDFVKVNTFVFCNVNLKYECSVLNALINKNIFNSDIDLMENRVYYIGNYFKNTYEMNHIGLTNNTLMNIQMGKHYFNNLMYKQNMNFVDSSNNPLFSMSMDNYLNSFSCYLDSTMKSSYIGKTSGELNHLETGISFNFPEDKDYSFLYVLGNDFNIKLPKADYMIYTGHHIPKDLNFHLYIPTISFYEVPQVNFVLPKWLNNQLLVGEFFDRIITSPGESYDNISIFQIISKLLFSSNDLLNNHFIKIEENYLFSSTYENLINIVNDSESFTNNILLLSIWNPKLFYQSDSYSQNSKTLYLAYKNHLNHFSESFSNPIIWKEEKVEDFRIDYSDED
jgi:NADH dehydrogenase (ubiquinone) Fe-S protein 1